MQKNCGARWSLALLLFFLEVHSAHGSSPLRSVQDERAVNSRTFLGEHADAEPLHLSPGGGHGDSHVGPNDESVVWSSAAHPENVGPSARNPPRERIFVLVGSTVLSMSDSRTMLSFRTYFRVVRVC